MSCRLTGLVAGLDEAGRGPLAGPVVSSCVVWEGLPPLEEKVNDSKLLSEKRREYLFGWILEHAYRVTLGMASPEEIERLNIHYASLLSMERAVRNTALRPRLLLVDGLFPLEGMDYSKPVVKGDRKCFFIACASIVAKVVRDRLDGRLRCCLSALQLEKEQRLSHRGAQAGHREVRSVAPPQAHLQGREGVLR